MMKNTVIIFDADGVIFPGGENMKDEAWDRMITRHPHPEHTTRSEWAAAITAARGEFGAGKGTGSRFDIIALALTETGLPSTNSNELVHTWAQTYNDMVQGMILELGVYPETLIALTTLSRSGHPLYVNTATPTGAIIESLQALHLLSFFTGVYGQPESKVQNLQLIAERESVPITSMVFIGDGSGDIRAATEVGCRFVGVANDSNNWSNQSFPLIRRLDELLILL